MNLKKVILTPVCVLALFSCANYNVTKSSKIIERKYYSSSGFALIYDDAYYKQNIVNKKIDNQKIMVMHNLLNVNTPVQIINPDNLKSIETKIYKKAKYPPIFNLVISEKIASILKLDPSNPYIQIIEIKKNKTFIAKKAIMFEEEKNVAEKAPVKKIEMDDLSKDQHKIGKNILKEKKFILLINDFYYEVSANNLKKELIKKINLDNISIEKINNNKYRLLAGPFKNFNALKTTYISLNNLGFEQLNIYRK